MTEHGPDRTAAYLAGDLDLTTRTDFEEHLGSCLGCWDEIALARVGRAHAESGRERAPASLRDHVRALVALDSLEAPRQRDVRPASGAAVSRRRLGAVAAAVGVLVATAALAPSLRSGSEQPAAIAAAVAAHQQGRLAGEGVPARAAPALRGLGLQAVGAAAGTVVGTRVTAYAYRDAAGRSVTLYVSDRPFPEAVGAVHVGAESGPWTAREDSVALLCAALPYPLLVVGPDLGLVRAVGSALGAI